MRLVEIKALDNGAHRNLTVDGIIDIPNGWAVIPDDMEFENFPFGDVEVEEIDGVMTVTDWVVGKMPISEKHEEPISETEQLRADVDYLAVMMGVEL